MGMGNNPSSLGLRPPDSEQRRAAILPRLLTSLLSPQRLSAGIRLAPTSSGNILLADAELQAEIEIVRYLITHLDARDTIEGIEKWWLPRSKEYGTDAVAAALRRLESHGLIGVWKSASAKPVYGLRSADSHLLQIYLGSLE